MIQCKGLVLFDLMFCLKEAAGWRVGVEDGFWEQIEESVTSRTRKTSMRSL